MSNLTVIKSNKYIECQYSNYKPTLVQNRVILWLSSLVHSQKDSDFRESVITVSEFNQVVGKHLTVSEVVDELACLRSATVVIKEGPEWIISGVINTARYHEDAGIIKLSLNDDMKPYLLSLKSNFTSFELGCIQKMKSLHSQRIYELLCQYSNLNRGDKRIMTLDKIKRYLGVKTERRKVIKEKFKSWYEFSRVILDRVERDLCNNGIYMSYKPLKRGRSVVSVEFTFSMHKDTKGDVLPSFLKLTMHDIDDYDKMRLSNMYDEHVIDQALIECSKTGNNQPLLDLLPNTRKQYQDTLSKRIEESLNLLS